MGKYQRELRPMQAQLLKKVDEAGKLGYVLPNKERTSAECLVKKGLIEIRTEKEPKWQHRPYLPVFAPPLPAPPPKKKMSPATFADLAAVFAIAARAGFRGMPR